MIPEAVYYVLAAVMSVGAAGWILIIRKMSMTFRLAPRLGGVPPDDPPMVSVIVPARNEENYVGRCLESLLAQDYPNYEVVAIDDSSEDRTGDIIAGLAAGDGRVVHVRSGQRPDGWMGKCWACMEGYGKASGELLLFTDADSVHSPGAVSAAVGQLVSGKLDALTANPRALVPGFWPAVFVPVQLCFGHNKHSMLDVNDPAKGTAYFLGSFYLIRRGAYEAAGTHEAVRDQIYEDMFMGRRAKAAGCRIMAVRGEDHVGAVMGRDLGGIWRDGRRPRVSGGGAAALRAPAVYALLLVAPLPALAISLLGGPGSWALLAASGACITMMFAGTAAEAVLGTASRWWHVALAPLGGLLLAARSIAGLTGSPAGYGGTAG
ncbi:Glycosyltransferase involved in cell wall biogenesis [Nitrosopumilaceae archaeon]|nr:glycosyltransferase [Nitrosopumilus sp.]MDA7997276.1 glycosyltransferase [Nitrosopumilus sp.]CAI9831685.1 Glycosyltransferase involved in cell wall biogenesis [Nitrosopumilaceae archaeon]